MDTLQIRNILHTDKSLDPLMVRRTLGAMSGDWSRQKFPVSQWIKLQSIKQDVKDFVAQIVIANERTSDPNPQTASIQTQTKESV